jgi:hypothetical protein
LAKLIAIAALVAVVCGCGSKEKDQASAAAAPTPEPTFWEGDTDVEEEYHQPPKPASGGVGDTITMTGSNIGVRLRVTVTGLVDRTGPGGRYLGVKLRLRNTGIAVFEGELRQGVVKFANGRRARIAFGVTAPCSNGFQRHMRFENPDRVKGCVLFRRPAGAGPRTMRLALESNPVSEGGLWRLG